MGHGSGGSAGGLGGGGQPPGVLRAHLLGAGHSSAPAAPARPPPLPATAPPSVERAMASAAGRAASRTSGLAAVATAVTPAGVSLAELPELLPEGALIAVIEGPGERLGVVALCPAMIASLIEMQAVGRVSTRAVPIRRSTRTDAAIAAEFVNLLLAEAATALGPLPLAGIIGGFRYASYLDDPRPLGLMLDDTGFHGISLGLRLGAAGERNGTVVVFVPGLPALATPAPASPAAAAAPAPPPAPARTTLAEAVQQAPVPLVAVLCRKTVTLRELRGLVPGATLTLPRNAMAQAQLETATGQPLTAGRLGEAEGYYALRLQPAGGAADDGLPSTLPMPPEPISDLDLPPAMEPPMADLSAPDLFRMEDTLQGSTEAEDGDAALPLSFVIS